MSLPCESGGVGEGRRDGSIPKQLISPTRLEGGQSGSDGCRLGPTKGSLLFPFLSARRRDEESRLVVSKDENESGWVKVGVDCSFLSW